MPQPLKSSWIGMVQMEMKKGKVLCQKLLGRQEGAGRVQSSNSHPQDGKEKWTSVCTLIPILLFFQSNKTQMVTQNKNYISQAPLQLGMVIWLRSTHGDVSRNGEGHFQDVFLKGGCVIFLHHLTPGWIMDLMAGAEASTLGYDNMLRKAEQED